MKQNYQTPLAEVVSLENREAVLQGGSEDPWYLIAAQGDFNYEVIEDIEFL